MFLKTSLSFFLLKVFLHIAVFVMVEILQSGINRINRTTGITTKSGFIVQVMSTHISASIIKMPYKKDFRQF